MTGPFDERSRLAAEALDGYRNIHRALGHHYHPSVEPSIDLAAWLKDGTLVVAERALVERLVVAIESLPLHDTYGRKADGALAALAEAKAAGFGKVP